MPRKKSRKTIDAMREQAVAELRAASEKYGPEAAAKLVGEKYRDEVPRSTWYRWISLAKTTPLDIASHKIRKVAKSLPAAPPPEYVAAKPAEARRNVDFLSRLEVLYADAEMLRAYSTTTDAEGNEKIRVPTFFSQSIKLRSDLLDNALKAIAQVWDLQRMQGLYDMIIEEVGKADPATQRRVLERLQALNERVGLSMEARV